MKTVDLQLAERADFVKILEIDTLRREDIIKSAIEKRECFLVVAQEMLTGFIIFNYNFFGRGFIDLIEIKKDLRGKGLGSAAIKRLFELCITDKLFTSTNESNEPMKNLLTKLDFVYAGTVYGLDEGDPELFYYKILK